MLLGLGIGVDEKLIAGTGLSLNLDVGIDIGMSVRIDAGRVVNACYSCGLGVFS